MMAEDLCANDPADVDRRFVEAFNAHDLDALVALYEPNAVLIPEAGQRIIGQDEIRKTIAGFLATFETFELVNLRVVENGDIALMYPEFVLRGVGEGGEPVTVEGRGTELV